MSVADLCGTNDVFKAMLISAYVLVTLLCIMFFYFFSCLLHLTLQCGFVIYPSYWYLSAFFTSYYVGQACLKQIF